MLVGWPWHDPSDEVVEVINVGAMAFAFLTSLVILVLMNSSHGYGRSHTLHSNLPRTPAMPLHATGRGMGMSHARAAAPAHFHMAPHRRAPRGRAGMV